MGVRLRPLNALDAAAAVMVDLDGQKPQPLRRTRRPKNTSLCGHVRRPWLGFQNEANLYEPIVRRGTAEEKTPWKPEAWPAAGRLSGSACLRAHMAPQLQQANTTADVGDLDAPSER